MTAPQEYLVISAVCLAVCVGTFLATIWLTLVY